MTKKSEELLEALNNAYRLKEQATKERSEKEMLLTGISALLAAESQKDMYRRMFDVLGNFLPYQEAFVLEQHAPGLMKCSTSTISEMESTLWLVDPVFKRTVLGKPSAVYSISRQPAWKEHQKLLNPNMSAALYCPFSGPEIDAILVFLHEEKGFYVQDHIHMAEKYRDFTQQTLLSVNAKLQALESQQLRKEKERTELALMQSEKMASLGLLAAGIAHEINNPIGYISSNFNYLAENIGTFSQLKAVLEQLIDDNQHSEEVSTIKSTKSAKDWIQSSGISEVLLDFEELVNDCKQGLHRVKEIVESLRNFARLDDESIQPVDINQCVEDTIKLVSNEIKYHCELHLELGKVELVQANEGKIIQVLTNLLVNASHAIDEKGDISITTGCRSHTTLGKCSWFCIEDNGCGIAPENLTKIFDPFYTSKGAEKGTGLGLAISYSIVEKLGGIIEVKSELNKGTRFTGFIPL